jgi:polyphosphate kinase
VVQVPQVLPRIVMLAGGEPGRVPFLLLEDVISARLPDLFGGFEVDSWTAFRITRDSDLELLEQESDDMLKLIEDRLKARQRGQAVRIEIAAKADSDLAELIIDEEGLQAAASGTDAYSEVYRIDGPLDLTALWELHRLPGFEKLHDKPFTPRPPRGLERHGDDIFTMIARRDIFPHHPDESFDPVVEFVTRAANDSRVLAI